MATRRLAPVLAELLDAITGIEAATQGKSVRDFEAEWLLRRGVERGIEIISEASRHLPDAILFEHPDIPWPQIRGIGNILRHEYHSVSTPILWAVVTTHLAPLKRAVLAIQAAHG